MVSATISLPMPSPGSTAIFMAADLAEQPGELRLTARLEGADLVGVAQRNADLVQAVQQRMTTRGVDVELVRLRTVGGRHGLPVEVHDQAEARQRAAVEQ